LPELPDIREEITVYYNSVYRCDQTVGKVLQALKESNFEDNTMVIFLSDNGMAFPFAKANCYLNSTKTPLIIRWPGKIQPGTLDDKHLITCLDITPTILDAIGLPPLEGMDGRSFLPLLLGQEYMEREQIFTVFNKAKEVNYPMRGLLTKKYAYIFNSWSNGRNIFIDETQTGLSMAAMVRAGQDNLEIAKRSLFYLYRVPEEFYDIETDPNALHNLIDSQNHKEHTAQARKQLEREMEATHDPLLETFRRREFLS
jgi:N-sulfoglucosamine sulfohydrolase